MKDKRDWIPDATDHAWIESIAAPLPAALAAIEAAAAPLGIPIVDRDAGRVLSVLAAGRRRIVEVGTAYGYSTALARARPAGRRHDRDDRPGPRTDRPRPGLVARRRRPRRADHARSRPRRSTRSRLARAGAGRTVRPRLHRRAQSRIRGVSRRADRRTPRPGRARRSPTTSCGAAACRGRARSATRTGTRRRCASSPSGSWAIRASAPRSCPSATACWSRPGAVEPGDPRRACPRPPLRDAARARGCARAAAGAARRRDGR